MLANPFKQGSPSKGDQDLPLLNRVSVVKAKVGSFVESKI